MRPLLRRGGALALLVLLAGAAWGQPGDTGPLLRQLEQGGAEERRRALQRLAEQGDTATVPQVAGALHDADPVVRKLAENALWSIWSRSGDEAVDELFKVGARLLAAGRAEQSVNVFTRVIERAPAFAEGWNKRATAYYHIGEYEKSLSDIDETLRRNPFHFGALSGAGLCLIELERYPQALSFFDRALRINPNLDGIQELMEAVEKRARKPMT
jgi:tetratricopeptide (TPR) repeat protein